MAALPLFASRSTAGSRVSDGTHGVHDQYVAFQRLPPFEDRSSFVGAAFSRCSMPFRAFGASPAGCQLTSLGSGTFSIKSLPGAPATAALSVVTELARSGTGVGGSGGILSKADSVHFRVEDDLYHEEG